MLSAETTISICATGMAREILKAIAGPVWISEIVRSDEIAGIKFEISQQRFAARILLDTLLSDSVLKALRPQSDAEWESFYHFSRNRGLDNSEAALRAIVLHRGWAVACDDPITVSFFASQNPPVKAISALGLIKFWGEITGVAENIITEALVNAKQNALLEPKQHHPLYEWWRASSLNSAG
jgi:hypothetical protein